MKSNLSETIEEIGRRGELEQEKLFYLLLNRQEEMRQELEEVPSYQKNLDFERLQYIIEAYRSHMRRGRDLFCGGYRPFRRCARHGTPPGCP